MAYLRALAAARSDPTPACWVRLLRASRNLKAAVADREKERQSGGWLARPIRREDRAVPLPASLPSPAAPASPAPARAAPRAASASPRPGRRPARFPEFEKEIARARALMAESRRLIAESRACCARARAAIDGRTDATTRCDRKAPSSSSD